MLYNVYEWIAHVSYYSIQQITTESAKSSLTSMDLRPNYHHRTNKLVKNGDRAIQVLDRTDKVGVKEATLQAFNLLLRVLDWGVHLYYCYSTSFCLPYFKMFLI